MTEPIIQFKHVEKRFNDQTVIPDLNFTVNKGEFITILGSSGSGKTTTLKMINGLIAPSAGEILVDGQKLRTRSSKIAPAHGICCPTDRVISSYDDWTKYCSCAQNAALG